MTEDGYEELLEKAKKMTEFAYAPYSKFMEEPFSNSII